MTPEEFRESVLPLIVSLWEERCLCDAPGFLRLLSFNFEDYKISPVALADSEIIGHEIVGRNFLQAEESMTSLYYRRTRILECPQCGTRCTENYTEYSIAMNRTYYVFENDTPPSQQGRYLIGFYGVHQEDTEAILDFEESSMEEFLDWLGTREEPGHG